LAFAKPIARELKATFATTADATMGNRTDRREIATEVGFLDSEDMVLGGDP
jgi:hypothetical protein